MPRLPGRYDKKWFVVAGVMFIFTFALFIIFKLMLEPKMSAKNIVAFAILSTLVSLISTIGGYLGFKVYFGISTISNIVALLYMMYIVISQQAPGWTDLVAIMAYMFIMGTGIVAGIVVEALVRLARKYCV